jgi:hypothetical protein
MLEPMLAKRYEELANHFAKQGESRQRDHCLVLAADAALSAGQPAEAERLRKRLLLTNPDHLLRPYSSMAEAMQSNDVHDFVVDLRRQWPPEMVAKLLNRPIEAPTAYAMEPPPTPTAEVRKLAARLLTAAPTEETALPGENWLGLLMFAVGLGLAGGLMFAAFGGSLLD